MATYYVDIDTDEPLSDHDLHERFDELLDEVYGLISICGYEYDAATTLRNVDPIAYRVGFSEWLDNEIDETIQELEN